MKNSKGQGLIMSRNNCVYIHIFPNGKVYVGQTKQTTAQRWIRGKGYKGQLVERAIKKYGWDNIRHEVLYSGLTEEEANEYEIRLIAQYNSTDERFGYNLLNGGKGKGQNLHHSKEHYKRVSAINSKEVDCYQRDGTYIATFKSVNAAADFVGGGFKVISACCRGDKRSGYGYIWRFKGDSFDKYDTENHVGGVKGFPVEMFTEDGILIGLFVSIKEASKCTGISQEKISQACKGLVHDINGVRFRFKEKNYEEQ